MVHCLCIVTMGDYGWSMDSDTPQGIDAVEIFFTIQKSKIWIHSKILDHDISFRKLTLLPREFSYQPFSPAMLFFGQYLHG